MHPRKPGRGPSTGESQIENAFAPPERTGHASWLAALEHELADLTEAAHHDALHVLLGAINAHVDGPAALVVTLGEALELQKLLRQRCVVRTRDPAAHQRDGVACVIRAVDPKRLHLVEPEGDGNVFKIAVGTALDADAGKMIAVRLGPLGHRDRATFFNNEAPVADRGWRLR